MKRSLQNYLLAFLLVVQSLSVVWATTPKAQEAILWIYKGVAAYEREDFGAAKTYVNMALETEPNFAEAYLLKGLLEYHDGQVEKANASWQKALDLNPRLPDDMRKKLESRAHKVEAGLTSQESSHFTLQFSGADERDKAWVAVKHLDEAYSDLGSRFNTFPEGKFSVIIFSSQEFWEAWNAPLWLGGFFDSRDGKIRVRIDTPPGGDEEYRRRVRHEFTHAFIHKLYSKDLPVWFQEGIAQFYAYSSPSNGFWKDARMESLKKETKGAPWMELTKVERVIKKKDVAPGLIYLGYLESEALILYVAKERGDSWIPMVVELLRAGKNFAEAYKTVVGITPEESMDHLIHSWS